MVAWKCQRVLFHLVGEPSLINGHVVIIPQPKEDERSIDDYVPNQYRNCYKFSTRVRPLVEFTDRPESPLSTDNNIIQISNNKVRKTPQAQSLDYVVIPRFSHLIKLLQVHLIESVSFRPVQGELCIDSSDGYQLSTPITQIMPSTLASYIPGTTLYNIGAKFICENFELLLKNGLDAIRQFHKQGFVHQNLHSHNILITADSKIRLIGFDRVKLTDDPFNYVTSQYTPPYPETVTPETNLYVDSFSLAVSFYYVISGNWPYPSISFLNDDGIITIEVDWTKPPTPLTQLNQTQNEALLKMLEVK